MTDRAEERLPSTERLLTAVHTTDLACQAAKEAALRPFDLSSALYGVLLVLDELPGTTGAELARRCGVTPQTMSSLLPRLEGRGLIRRTRHPEYRQVVRCELTAAGLELLRQADERVRALELRLRAALSPAEDEALRTLLARLRGVAGAFPGDVEATGAPISG